MHSNPLHRRSPFDKSLKMRLIQDKFDSLRNNNNILNERLEQRFFQDKYSKGLAQFGQPRVSFIKQYNSDQHRKSHAKKFTFQEREQKVEMARDSNKVLSDLKSFRSDNSHLEQASRHEQTKVDQNNQCDLQRPKSADRKSVDKSGVKLDTGVEQSVDKNVYKSGEKSVDKSLDKYLNTYQEQQDQIRQMQDKIGLMESRLITLNNKSLLQSNTTLVNSKGIIWQSTIQNSSLISDSVPKMGPKHILNFEIFESGQTIFEQHVTPDKSNDGQSRAMGRLESIAQTQQNRLLHYALTRVRVQSERRQSSRLRMTYCLKILSRRQEKQQRVAITQLRQHLIHSNYQSRIRHQQASLGLQMLQQLVVSRRKSALHSLQRHVTSSNRARRGLERVHSFLLKRQRCFILQGLLNMKHLLSIHRYDRRLNQDMLKSRQKRDQQFQMLKLKLINQQKAKRLLRLEQVLENSRLRVTRTALQTLRNKRGGGVFLSDPVHVYLKQIGAGRLENRQHKALSQDQPARRVCLRKTGSLDKGSIYQKVLHRR